MSRSVLRSWRRALASWAVGCQRWAAVDAGSCRCKIGSRAQPFGRSGAFHANGVAPLKRQDPSLTPADLVRVYQDVTVQGMADEEAADVDAVEAHLFGPPPRLRKRHTVPVQTQTIETV